MDHTLMGALVAVGGMLLVCAVEEVRFRRRVSKRQRVMAAAELRATAGVYSGKADASRGSGGARIRRAALNSLATDLVAQARRLEGGAR